MGIAFVLIVLVIGYYYADNYTPAKVLLKRSNGWEAYVYLGKYGISFLLSGVFVTAFLFLFLYLISFLLNIPLYFLGAIYSPFNLENGLSYDIFNNENFSCPVYLLLVVIFSFFSCKGRLKKKNQDRDKVYDELASTNSVLNVVLEGMKNQIPVKVSLKSKKVYVGFVDSEQFESADLDNTVIIPLLSGYRDKDTLNVIFDCDYLDIYLKNEIPMTSIPSLRYFRTIIRLSEIESISLFNLQYYDDFKKATQNHQEK